MKFGHTAYIDANWRRLPSGWFGNEGEAMAMTFVRGDVVRENGTDYDATVERLAGDTWAEDGKTFRQESGTVGLVWFEGNEVKRKLVNVSALVRVQPRDPAA